jgi:transaldolase
MVLHYTVVALQFLQDCVNRGKLSLNTHAAGTAIIVYESIDSEEAIVKKESYFQRVKSNTATRFWINNVTSVEACLAIEAGADGCTQNPSYTWKMMEDEKEKKRVFGIVDRLLSEGLDDSAVLLELQRLLISDIAGIFLPMYQASGGRCGYVSIQGDPFREDADTIVAQARSNRVASPNIMAKVPATEDGLAAIAVLAAERVPINATEIMTVQQALDVCSVYMKATAELFNPAPLYYSVITGIYDEYLHAYVAEKGIDVSSDALWQAGMAVAKKTYALVRERTRAVTFIGGGARGLHHFTEMVGADACITINWKGAAETLLTQDPPVVQRFLQPTPDSVVDELLGKVEDFRRAYLVHAIAPHEYESFGAVVHFRKMFEDAWRKSLDAIALHRTGA